MGMLVLVLVWVGEIILKVGNVEVSGREVRWLERLLRKQEQKEVVAEETMELGGDIRDSKVVKLVVTFSVAS